MRKIIRTRDELKTYYNKNKDNLIKSGYDKTAAHELSMLQGRKQQKEAIELARKRKYEIKQLSGKTPKSRKGKYALLVDEKGKKRYIKITQPKDERTVKLWTKRTDALPFKKYKQLDKYVAKIKRYGTIDSKIKKGITEVTSNAFHRATGNSMAKIKEQLLRPLVKDDEILRLLCQEENFNKLKHRLEYKVEIQDKEGQHLAELKKANEIPEIIKQHLNENQIEEGVLLTYHAIKQLAQMHGYGHDKTKENTIGQIRTTITFRRG